MSDHIQGKSVVVTGAASGFGMLVSQKLAARGAAVTCSDINEEALQSVVASINASGGEASCQVADVTDLGSMKRLAALAVEERGRLDVMINNAGVMPLAFFSDHEQAADAWSRCIDINFKGVLNGMIAAYDPMMAQERGQIVNMSSIYGNFPVAGAAVYGATKAAVNMLSESLRLESRGKIKVTTIKPTGVPNTGLMGGIVNLEASAGIVGEHFSDLLPLLEQITDGSIDPALVDPQSIGYTFLDPSFIADQVVDVIDKPWGVSLSDVTVRAAGDYFKL